MAAPSSPDPNSRVLYVGNVDVSVTEAHLQTLFDSPETKVIKVKLKNKAGSSAPHSEFGFIEFEDHEAAAKALQKWNGHKLNERELKVNWANSSPSYHPHTHHYNHNAQGNTGHHHHHHNNHHHANHGPRDHTQASAKVGTNGLYNVFVGDLDSQVDDAVLKSAFSAFSSVEDAKVMLDSESGTSRGFGFVMFKEKSDAQKAITEMNGKPLLTRNMRLNWAHPNTHANTRKPTPPPAPLDYNEVLMASPPTNVTVYVGNLSPDVTAATLQELFAPYGDIAEVRDHADSLRANPNGEQTHRGYGFILFKNHESAARAIVALNGKTLNGKQLKCSWGNEKRPLQNTTGALLPGFPYGPNGFGNGYGANLYFYPQYGFPGIQPGTMPQLPTTPLTAQPGQQATPQAFVPPMGMAWPYPQGNWNPQNPTALMPIGPFAAVPTGAAVGLPLANSLNSNPNSPQQHSSTQPLVHPAAPPQSVSPGGVTSTGSSSN